MPPLYAPLIHTGYRYLWCNRLGPSKHSPHVEFRMPPKKTSAEEDAAMYAALLKTCITVVCATEIADTSAKARNYATGRAT